MEQIRTLEAIKTEVNKLVKDREESIRLLMEKHDQAIQNETIANEKAQKAYEEMDIKGYHKALEEVRINKDAAEMFLVKKKEIEGKPYIDKEKYESLASEVFQCLDQVVQDNTNALVEPIQKLAEITESTFMIVADGNKFLQYLQLEVYKDAGIKITDDGFPIYMRSKKKHYDNFRLSSLWELIKNDQLVKEILEKMENF